MDFAKAIRDLIVERLRRYRDAGLGDPEERHKVEAAGGADGDALAAARRVLEEARGLRGVVEAG